MKRDLTVYTCAVWYHDSDAHTSVVATTAKLAERAARRAMKESAQAYASSDDSPCSYCDRGKRGDHLSCLMDAQAWSGVFPESLREVLSNARERDMVLSDLRASGVAYLDTP